MVSVPSGVRTGMAALPELAGGPALRLRALDPGHDRDVPRRQLAEQARAPALAVEHQRQARLPARGQAGQPALPVGRRQQPAGFQLRHDAVPDLAHHAVIHRPVQAQQRRAAQRVGPVADRGRQGQLLPRHEVLGQLPLAPAVDLHVAVDEQRGDGFGIVRAPVPGQGRGPLRQSRRVRQLARAAAQGARAGAAVQPQQGSPLAGLLVAQPLGVAHPRQQQEGPQQQHRRHAVEALGQLQAAGVPQQARCQQRRQRGQHPAHGDRRAALETRLAPVQQAQAGRHAAFYVVRRAA